MPVPIEAYRVNDETTVGETLFVVTGAAEIFRRHGCDRWRAETPIQGFLYKIGTFLAWLHRYAPVAGRQPVPGLEDLYDRRIAVTGWAT